MQTYLSFVRSSSIAGYHINHSLYSMYLLAL
jgi:hypothetical protein